MAAREIDGGASMGGPLIGIVLLCLVIIYWSGLALRAVPWLGVGSSTEVKVLLDQLGESRQVKLYLPPTNGSISLRLVTPEAGSLQLPDAASIPTSGDGDSGAIVISSGFCSAGCTVPLLISSDDDLSMVIDYLAGDSEYVDDIDLEYVAG